MFINVLCVDIFVLGPMFFFVGKQCPTLALTQLLRSGKKARETLANVAHLYKENTTVTNVSTCLEQLDLYTREHRAGMCLTNSLPGFAKQKQLQTAATCGHGGTNCLHFFHSLTN